MSFNNITCEESGAVAIITVNRPNVLNALNSETVLELTSAMEQADKSASIKVVVLTGSGEKAFVAGADIAGMLEMSRVEALEFSKLGHGLMNAIESSRKPVIAAVNGYALGGGAELLLACDIVYASDNAKFGLPEVKLGIFPGFGGTQRLPRLIGAQRARELIFTGRVIDSTQALAWGLVNKVVPLAQLKNEAMKLANEIAANGPLAVFAAKGVVNDGANMFVKDSLRHEQQEFAKLFETADRKEGMQAFLDKRPPRFESL